MMRLAMAVVLVAGCAKAGSGGAGDTGPFRVFYPEADVRDAKDILRMRAGKRLQAKPAANCRTEDGVEARWANTGARVETGELPPGIVIEDGAIAGVPKDPGTWQVAIKFTGVTCGSAAKPDQLVPLTIIVSAGK